MDSISSNLDYDICLCIILLLIRHIVTDIEIHAFRGIPNAYNRLSFSEGKARPRTWCGFLRLSPNAMLENQDRHKIQREQIYNQQYTYWHTSSPSIILQRWECALETALLQNYTSLEVENSICTAVLCHSGITVPYERSGGVRVGCLNRPSAVDRFLDSSRQSRFSHIRWPNIFNHTRGRLGHQMRPILIPTTC